jgi:alanine dehydrogenase
MRVAVPKETAPGERRVALVPETVSKLREAGFEAASSVRGRAPASRTTTTRPAGATLVD